MLCLGNSCDFASFDYLHLANCPKFTEMTESAHQVDTDWPAFSISVFPIGVFNVMFVLWPVGRLLDLLCRSHLRFQV